MFNRRSRYGMAALALIAISAALIASGRDRGSSAETAGLGYMPAMTSTPVAVAPERLSGGVTSHSVLVMIQGLRERRLVVWPLLGFVPPQEIDRYVNENLLRPDPAGTRVLYNSENTLMVLDVREQRASVVAELPPNAKPVTVQWSPDGTGIAYVLAQGSDRVVYYVPADGSRMAYPFLHVNGGLPLDVAWLADGRPVAVFARLGSLGGMEARYQAYDPVTGESEVLPPDTPVIQPYAPWRSTDGRYQMVPSIPWTESWASGVCQTGSLELIEADWMFTTGTAQAKSKVFYTRHNVYLDRVTWLRDGRILFRGTADEACTPGGSGLYLTRLDGAGEPVQIVQTESNFPTPKEEDFLWRLPYALSPDQTLVAWADNDAVNRVSTIHLTDLDTGATSLLYQTPPATSGGAFEYQDEDMIVQFVWLP